MNRRKEKIFSDITCHWWSLIIPIGSHRQHICSSFAARMWWAEAAYPLITRISALFIHLLPDPSYVQKFFVSENLQWKCVSFLFLFSPSYTKSSVFTKLSRATTSHLVCCCIKLWHQPILIVSRPGRGWVFILFSVSVLQNPAKADNEKRCMMSCRQSMQRQNLVTKFPGSYSFPLLFPLLSFPLLCLFSNSLQWGKSKFFFSSDNIQVLHLWECTW